MRILLADYLRLRVNLVRLSQIGVRREDFQALARRAAEQWTGSFNPRPLAEADALSLYESVY